MEIFVGWQKIEDDSHVNYGKIELYTVFPHAITILSKQCEFYYQKEHECMVAVVSKLPTNRKITFYEEFACNKPANKAVRDAMIRDSQRLSDLDEEFNKTRSIWLKQKEAFEKKESDIKQRMFLRLMKHGQTVKRGRWYHRALFTNWFRIFSKTDFPRPILTIDADVIRDLATRFKKFRTTLESTIKLKRVEIDPELYERKIKNCLSPKDLKQVNEIYEVDENELDKVVINLPYNISHQLWEMRSPVDVDGNPFYAIHAQTHQSKNPDCLECGGKFKKNSNVCKNCGLESHVKTEKGKKTAKASKHTAPRKNKIIWMRPAEEETSKKPSKRKIPSKGYGR